MRPVPDRQILRGAAATLSWQPTGADGEPADPGAAVTIGVTTAAGATVVAAGTATVGATTEPRTYDLAARADLDLLTATWSVDGDAVATQLVEIVGGYWFTVDDVITRDPNMNGQTYPADRVLAVRAEVEAELEDLTNAAWVPRYRRAEVAGSGECTLYLPDVYVRAVRSVRRYTTATAYTTFSSDQVAALAITEGGAIEAQWTFDRACRYVVEYEHGAQRPPADLRNAAITLLRYRMNTHRAGVPDRATSMTSGGVSYSLTTPGLRGAVTGIPDVDVVIERYAYPRFGIA